MKVLGVLEFICVAFILILGIVLLVAQDAAAEVAAAAEISSPIVVPILFFVLAVIGLIEGILMFRCAKDGRHSTLLIIFAVISLILGFANSSVSFSNWSWSGFIIEVISAGLDSLVIGAALQLRKLDSRRAAK